MTGAMYSAVAGLKTHMSKLNVISNNVANANTNAYKSSRVTFLESLYTSTRAGSDGTSILGGNNPSQIGYGCSIGTIDLDMSTKNYMPTGMGTDVMINGDGFLMVGDKTGVDNITSLSLSRLGDLGFYDADGYLVDGRGNVVYGFLTTNGGTEGLKARTGTDENIPVSSQLVPIRLPFAAPKSDDATAPREGTALYPGKDADGKLVWGETDTSNYDVVQLEGISIDKTGKITGINKATEETVVLGYIALGSVDNPNGVTHIDGPYYKAMGGAGGIRVASVGGIVEGQLYLKDGANSGTSVLTGSKTEFVPNGLESSGTDVATEFSEMITTQRGYQANTRIITVTDSMLEELVNMKR